MDARMHGSVDASTGGTSRAFPILISWDAYLDTSEVCAKERYVPFPAPLARKEARLGPTGRPVNQRN